VALKNKRGHARLFYIKNMENQEHTNCYICRFPSVSTQPTAGSYLVDCPRCGRYRISGTAASATSKNDPRITENRALLSGILYLLNETMDYDKFEDTPLITDKNIDSYLQSPLVPDTDDIEKKSELLLESIKRKTKNYGDRVDFEPNKAISWGFAHDQNELFALLDLLEDSGYIVSSKSTGSFPVKITASGWKYLKTETKRVNYKKGFIAIKFDEMDDSIDAISQAITDAGFEPKCIKNEHFDEIIMNKALGEIRESGFVVVDLTGDSSNVLFEAGFAYGLSKKIIFVCKEENKGDAKFYSKHFKIYFYKSNKELAEVLTQAIRAIVK